MKCKCGQDIPEERVEFLQSTGRVITCVACSKEQPKVGYVIYAHKTAGEVVVIPNREDGTHDEELVRQAERAYHRSR